MSNGLLNDPTMQGLQYALNSLSMRQQVLGNNVANAQTPGFVAQDVSFESHMAAILDGSANAGAFDTGQVINAPDLTARGDGNTVNMESQMSKIGETNLMYDALTQLTADRLGIIKAAITG